MAAETAIVLFTDVVGSTELRQRVGEERADALDRVHHDLLTNVIRESGGTVVKGLGDGVMAVFAGAAEAVGAAVTVQQAVERHGREDPAAARTVRVGVSGGDVVRQDGDYHGTAVVEASRLCTAAQGGQVLVADIVRALTRGRGGFRFEPIGELRLKGLEEPVSACSVAWDPVPAAAPNRLPFPHLLAADTAVSYTGRPGLLADLRAAWERVESCTGSRLVLLVGEPGVGKTRTSSELARAVHTTGTPVLYGRCDEALALSYQPFVEALDWQTSHAPQAPLGRFAGDLRRLVPDLDQRVPGIPTAIVSDARAEEHRLYEATASWLVAASRDAGLLLVVDDLHWATRPTLQLLVHVVRAAVADPDARLLVVGTYRDTDVDRSHPLASVLGDLRRLPGVERLPVAPLSETEVLDFVTTAAGHELDDSARELARHAYAETEGNPFFVGEVLRHFIETGVVQFDEGRWVVSAQEAVNVPEGVRDVVGRRLDRLSGQAGDVLTAAAVIGREFALDVTARVAELDVHTVVDVLDEALRARLVAEMGTDRFRFAHALTRQTLYEELSATRRRRLHHRVVQALEELRPGDLSALSHHSVEAGPIAGDLSSAVRYTLAAGEQALASRAVADARSLFEQVLELLEGVPAADSGAALRARCGLGEAQRDSGDAAHRGTLLAVTSDALAAGEVELATRAALANGRVFDSNIGDADRERVQALEDVLAHIDPHGPDRAPVLAALASELAQEPAAVDRRLALVDEALQLAERSGQPAVRARVVVAIGNAINVPDRVAGLPELFRRAIRSADESGDPRLRVGARVHLAIVLQQHGRLGESRATQEAAHRIAEDEGNPSMRWSTRNFTAQFQAWDGNLAVAHALLQDAFELGQSTGEPDAFVWWAGASSMAAWGDGTLGDWTDAIRQVAEQHGGQMWWFILHAHALVEAGRDDEARAIVEPGRLTDPTIAAPDVFTFRVWEAQSVIIGRLGLREHAEAMLARLEPHRSRWGALGTWVGLPLTISIANCLTAIGDHDHAADAALQGWNTLRAQHVRSHVPLAAALVAPLLARAGSATLRTRAHEVARQGLVEARAMQMERRVAELSSLAERLADTPSSSASAR